MRVSAGLGSQKYPGGISHRLNGKITQRVFHQRTTGPATMNRLRRHRLACLWLLLCLQLPLQAVAGCVGLCLGGQPKTAASLEQAATSLEQARASAAPSAHHPSNHTGCHGQNEAHQPAQAAEHPLANPSSETPSAPDDTCPSCQTLCHSPLLVPPDWPHPILIHPQGAIAARALLQTNPSLEPPQRPPQAQS
jgi:hypothetical protein